MILSLLFACSPGNIVLTEAGSDGTPGVTDDTGAEEEDQPHFAEGSYEAEVWWAIEDPGDWGYDWEMCEGEDFDMDVDAEGSFNYSGSCIYYGQQDDYDMAFEMAGSVDDDGNISGEISFDTWGYDGGWYLDTLTGDISGEVEDGEFGFDFDAEVYMGDWGTLDVVGDVQGEIQ